MSRGWLLLFGLIGASLIPLVLGGSDMFPRLRAFPLDSLLLMFGMIVVCWFINGLRLRLLLAGRAGKLGQLQSVGIIMASEFAFCATPGGSGGPLTLMALLARRGLGVDIQWAWTFLIQMVSLSAGQLSLIPGGAGGTELTSAALLAPMIGKSTAAAAIVIWRAVTFYFYLVAGGPVFAVLAGRPLLKKLISSREASS
ncbi:TPA: lysylphosphatidylglycerol synthase domain-containing protein [Pseudomonas aeruginosa]